MLPRTLTGNKDEEAEVEFGFITGYLHNRNGRAKTAASRAAREAEARVVVPVTSASVAAAGTVRRRASMALNSSRRSISR